MTDHPMPSTSEAVARWWADADETARDEARRTDYFSEAPPSPPVLHSLIRSGVAVTGTYWPSVQDSPDAFEIGSATSDALRALDAEEPRG